MAVDARAWARSLYASFNGDRATAAKLREASIAGDRACWTQTLTGVVAHSLHELGLEVAAKGHRCTTLPVEREEYLALDLTAFQGVGRAWRFPVAVCELENSTSDALVAYALWKVLCVRDALRVLFCFRSTRSDARRLIGSLARDVIGTIALPDREQLNADTLVFVGLRSESHTFPYGFFQAWCLNRNLGQFETFGWPD